MRLLQEECVCPPGKVPVLPGEGWQGIGSGWSTYADELNRRQEGAIGKTRGEYYPHAQDVAVLAADAAARGLAVSAEQALPIYLRDQVVHKPATK